MKKVCLVLSLLLLSTVSYAGPKYTFYGFTSQGTYAGGTTYVVGDIVANTEGTINYLCYAASCPAGTAITNTSYYVPLLVKGDTGSAGAAGANGQGVPTGGTTGQVLSKVDETNYNTQWIDATSSMPSGMANYILATPNGSTGTASLRALVAADIPTLNQNTTGTAANVSGTPTLPNGVSATTQASGDNSTKLATTAYVNQYVGVCTDGDCKATYTNNTTASPTGSAYESYFEGGVFKANQNGTESSIAIGPTGTQINFSGTLTDTKACTFATGGTISCNSDIPTGAGSETSTHASPSTTSPLSPTWTAPMHTVWYGVAGTINLPAASGYSGKGIIIYNTGAYVVTIDPNSSEVIVRDGTAQTGGVTMTLSSGAGNYVALICDGARWITLGYKGTLAVGS